MGAKIFLSCGQSDDRERDAAARIKQALFADGFEVYIAIQAQSIQDVNSGIIGELQRSDYYLFIDFARECLSWGPCSETRGSLFTNQELAIAYVSGFEHVLFFREKSVRLEGLLRYMASNATVFTSIDELIARVPQAVRDHGWQADYSRHLVATSIHWRDGIQYKSLQGRFLYVDIKNKRKDRAAFDTTARLESIVPSGGVRYASPNRSHLKVFGEPTFHQVIWPSSEGTFDALVVDDRAPPRVFLNNALDVFPLPALLQTPGCYSLKYAVLARDFPVLSFTIDLELAADVASTTATLRESGAEEA